MKEARADFDLTFRPDYWRPSDPISVIIANSKGEVRRRQILDVLEHEREGGEYLPDYSRGEIEIARIVLASATTDVVSVRAHRTRDLRIHYRVVDEHETRFVHHPRSSKAPLTFAQLVSLLDSVRREDDEPGHEYIPWNRDGNYRFDRGEPAKWSHFVTVESAFYRQLEAFYRQRNDRWLANELTAIGTRAAARV